MVDKVGVVAQNGKIVELRFRANRRIAIREADLPSPPPREIALMCLGERIEARLITRQFGFAVYYMPSSSEAKLAELLESHEEVPCVLTY
ncbi:MAG: hypothetical protein ACO2PN_20400 [Pyrobaculum sp.]|jgi:hypothetical protein